MKSFRNRSRPCRAAVALLVVLLLLGATGWTLDSGSGYTLVRWTVDGGGVAAHTAGGYTLSATAGQPDAHTLDGGTYTLRGGFWGGEAASASAPPGERLIFLPLLLRNH